MGKDEVVDEEAVRAQYADVSREDIDRKFDGAALRHRQLAVEAAKRGEEKEAAEQQELARACGQKYAALTRG